MIDEKIKNIKVAIHNLKERNEAEEKLFELGGWWLNSQDIKSNKKLPSEINVNYIFVNDDGMMTYMDKDKKYYDEHQYREVYVDVLLNFEPKPKSNEFVKYDFSEWVGKVCDNLCIFGDNVMLKSWNTIKGISIQYDNFHRDIYRENISYRETTLDNLQYGDIFITKNRVETNIKGNRGFYLDDFEIYIGKSNDGVDFSLHLSRLKETPMTKRRDYYSPERKKKIVYKFMRV
jgi:hypothetical protein